MRNGLSLFVAVCAAGSALAHMEMSYPYPFRSNFNPDETDIDYNNKDPLSKDGSNFPCKGYHLDSTLESTATYTAGQTAHMTIAGSATHSGGSCQMSLSYDGGTTFRVIQSMMGGCPLPKEYDFPIPSSAPDGEALLAWSWFNLIGNREMYMNCAPVTIEGGSSDSSEFDQLPELFAANVGNGCETVENQHTVFADPGEAVIYDDGVTSESEPFPIC